jgi:hypothetical protein
MVLPPRSLILLTFNIVGPFWPILAGTELVRFGTEPRFYHFTLAKRDICWVRWCVLTLALQTTPTPGCPHCTQCSGGDAGKMKDFEEFQDYDEF